LLCLHSFSNIYLKVILLEDMDMKKEELSLSMNFLNNQ